MCRPGSRAFRNWRRVLIAQALFFTFHLLPYLLSSRTAHGLVGYFEEEAVASYINARLREVVIAVRQDEAVHRDVNHAIAAQAPGRVPIADAL